MKSKNRECVLFLVLGVCFLSTPQFLSTEVLYAPFECYNSIPHQQNLAAVYVYVGGGIQPLACKFNNGLPPVLRKVDKAFEFDGSRSRPLLQITDNLN